MVPSLQLRQLSSRLHAETERSVAAHLLLDNTFDQLHYERMLRTLAACWLPIQANLIVDGFGRELIDGLAADLEALKPLSEPLNTYTLTLSKLVSGKTERHDNLQATDATPPHDRTFAWLGYRYVFFGSALGGKAIYRQIVKNTKGVNLPLQYYRACAEWPRDQWRIFQAILDRELADEAPFQDALTGAEEAFKRFQDCWQSVS